MRGVTSWSFAPFKPLTFETGDIYICRMATYENGIELEWLQSNGAPYTVEYRRAGEDEFCVAGQTEQNRFLVGGLETGTLYELRVVNVDGTMRSRIRSARPGKVEGTVVNYLAPEDEAYFYSGRFLCSPSLVRHPDGYLLASMDVYEGHAPQNLSLVFRSDDEGETWRYQCELFPCFWGKLFVHGRRVYMLSVNTEYGDLQIGFSEDGGKSFCTPTVLLRGSAGTSQAKRPGVHKNPQPVVEYGGRLWITLEWGSWGIGRHDAMVASVDVNADIMEPSNWHFSEPVAYNPEWEGVAQGKSSGNIEGCLVVAPDGKLYNYMRYDMRRCEPNYGLILRYEVDTENPDARLIYRNAIKFPGNHSKFEIKYDEKSGYYYSIIDRILNSDCANSRNLLSLMRSKDTEEWELVCDLIDRRDSDPQKIGFQYVDFIMEENDLLWLCRTADNGANSFHDSNYITFHRTKNFRTL